MHRWEEVEEDEEEEEEEERIVAVPRQNICAVRNWKPQSDKGWMIRLPFFLRKKYHRSLNRCRRHENSETLNKSGRSNSIKQQQLPRQLPFSQMEISDDREMFTD